MKTKHFKLWKCLIGIVVAAVLIFLDQWTKHLAVLHLKGQEAYPIWEGVFELQYLENRGSAFGLMQGKQTILIVFTIVMLAFFGYVFYRLPSGKRYYWAHIFCVLLAAGAIGNFIDRVRYRYVVDFFYFKLINFPIFNVADIYVVVSIAMMLLSIFYYQEEDYDKIFPSKKKKVNADEETKF